MLDQYKLKEIEKAKQSQYIRGLRASTEKSVAFAEAGPQQELERRFGQSVLALPADDEVMFEMGETTKLAEPYWKINQLVMTKFIDSTHSSTEIINDFFLIDKDRYAVSCSNDKSIRITNLITGDNRLAIPYANKEGSRCILMVTKGLIASGGKDGEIKLFDPSIGQSAGILVGHANTVWKMIEMPGEALVSASEDHTLQLMNCYKTIVSPQNKPIRCLFRFNETKLVFASTRVWLYNIHRDDIEKTFNGHTGFVRSIAVDKKYNRLITGAEDDTLRIWSMDTCQPLKVFTCHEPRCMEVWHEEFLVTGHSSFEIRFWTWG
jgi:WD40 repeat protein